MESGTSLTCSLLNKEGEDSDSTVGDKGNGLRQQQEQEIRPEEIWTSRRFQDWKTGFDKLVGGETEEDAITFASCPEPEAAEVKCGDLKIELEVSKEGVADQQDQDEKVTLDLHRDSAHWKEALAQVTLSPPTTPAELTEYLIGYSKLTVMGLGELVLNSIINMDQMESYIKVDLRQVLLRKVEEEQNFPKIITDATLQAFDLWFDKFVLEALTDNKRSIARVFKTVDIIFGAKFKKLEARLCWDWAVKFKRVDHVLSSLFDSEDDESELAVMKAIGGIGIYRKRKLDMASMILRCLERLVKFDSEMARSLKSAPCGCRPDDLELTKLAREVKGDLGPLWTVDPTMTQITLEARMTGEMEVLRTKWAETNTKAVELEKALVDQAVEYVKSRHVAMLEGRVEGYHLDQVGVFAGAFEKVPGFEYSSMWDPERVRRELVQACDQWVLRLKSTRTEQVCLPLKAPLDQVSDISSAGTVVMDQQLVVDPSNDPFKPYEPSGIGIFISATGIYDESESWKLSMSIRNPGAPEVKSTFDVTTLLTSKTPFAGDRIQFKPKSPRQQVYSEEILALQFRRIAKTLAGQFKKPAEETLVLAVPSETSSTSRVRLKTAVTLAGFASSVFIQVTTAIAVGYAAELESSSPTTNSSTLLVVYIQNSLIDVTIFEVKDGRCSAISTGSFNDREFEINVRTLGVISEYALKTIGSVLETAHLTIAQVQKCVLLVDKSLVKQGNVWNFGNCALRLHSRIQSNLAASNPTLQVDLRGRKLVHQGLKLISKEAKEYNQSALYREKCPWTLELHFGTGSPETLLEANSQMADAVVKRVKSRQLVGDALAVRRRQRNDASKSPPPEVMVQGIHECKEMFADSGAYIDVECDPQGLVDLRPCELWEETFALQRSCMPVKPAVVRSAKERIEILCRMAIPRQSESAAAAEKRRRACAEGASVSLKRRRSM